MSNEYSDIVLRIVRPEDAPALLEIYAPYVEKTAISFEYEVPGVDEFQRRIEDILKKYPCLAAEKDGEICGYAYTHAFVGRAAYEHCAETTIYLKEDKQKMGLGKKLYRALEEISKLQNIYNLYACIGYPEKEDAHLTRNSVQFHEHIGYRLIGNFSRCGYKFGTWYDMVWMEKILEEHPKAPEPVVWFPELSKEQILPLLPT
ncbi:N-acetyltransferase family protein [Lachnospiraceae bacterium 38-10]